MRNIILSEMLPNMESILEEQTKRNVLRPAKQKENFQSDQWDENLRGQKMSNSTGRVIYKYQMPVQEHFEMGLPENAEILRMTDEKGMFWLWAVVNTNASNETRKFHAFKCGGKIPDELNLKYIGCCAIYIQAELMLYIFEEL